MAALGLIEVKGFVAAMAAADAMFKAAGVRMYKNRLHADGVFALLIRADDVGSAKAATDAGAEAAKSHGQVVAVHVIAKPDSNAVQAVVGSARWDDPTNTDWIPV
jgi:ethanolamine utilization protein EutM